MCIRFKRPCPGLDDGPLIVDMTKQARYGMKKRSKKQHSKTSVLEDQAWAPLQISINRISHAAVATDAFFGRFLTYFTSEGDGKDIQNRLSWLHRLPQLSVDGTNDALTLAVQATASAYCAVEAHHPCLIRHAWDLYGRAIQSHSRFLSRSRKGSTKITVHMISTSVLFSFFEAMQATSIDAYRSHIYGAAKMFEITNPKQCTEGVLCQIFFHLRTQMAFVQLTGRGKKTPVDVRRILYGALVYDELPMFQRLTTHFTKLADEYSEMENLGRHEQREMDEQDVLESRAAIDALWHEYNASAAFNDEVISWHDPVSNTIQYRDAFTALVIAYFSAVRILLALKAPFLQSGNVPDYFQSILDAARFMETRHIGCAYMRIAAPLLLVALHAPNAEQERRAIEYFDDWKLGSMRGISALALERIGRRWQAVGNLDRRTLQQSEKIMRTDNHDNKGLDMDV